MLFVHEILAIIGIAFFSSSCLCSHWLSSPFTLSTLHSILESTCVSCTISPFILSKLFWFSIYILSYILISIMKKITSITMSEVIEPLTFIFIIIFPNMNSISLGFTINPLANIGGSIFSSPDSVSIFQAHFPFTIVNFTI